MTQIDVTEHRANDVMISNDEVERVELDWSRELSTYVWVSRVAVHRAERVELDWSRELITYVWVSRVGCQRISC